MTQHAALHFPRGLRGTEWEHGDFSGLACEKLVVGDHASPQEGAFPGGIRAWPEGLKSLHVQGVTDLRAIPAFEACPDLETIDLRGCKGIVELPSIERLSRLEWLDLEDCASLSALPHGALENLQFLYLSGCRGLSQDEIVRFLEALGTDGAPRLVELELARTRLRCLPRFGWRGYWDREDDPTRDHGTRWSSRRWLEKIVLASCKELREIELPLADLPNLRHVDVSGCALLGELPRLPEVPAYPAPHPQRVLQYLRVDGTVINAHAGCSVRPSHRREAEGIAETRRNAADTFLAFQELGDPVPFPECRLMVLGNSMAGKTNVVRRLIYGIPGDDPEGYVEPEGGRAAWKPQEGLDSTHPIHCPTWRVRLKGYDQPAAVHLWDYGGQHKYHRSHRTFAREGTFFLLVWRHPSALPSQDDAAREQELLKDEPVARTLEYWLDYIVACGACREEDLPEHVLIVCTQAGGQLDQGVASVFHDQLGKHKDRRLNSWTVETVKLDEDGERERAAWRRFHAELRQRVRGAIERSGDRVPGLFARVAEHVARDRRACEEDRLRMHLGARGKSTEDPTFDEVEFRRRALPSESQWSDTLAEVHGARLPAPHQRALTQALHDAGGLFWLRPPARPEARFVVVDQGLALDWVYTLLAPQDGMRFQTKCREAGGWFNRSQLVTDPRPGRQGVRLFATDWEEERALSILEQCRLVLRDGNRYLALEDALLPDLGAVQAEVEGHRRAWKERKHRAWIAGSTQHVIGHDQFQDFRAWFVGELRKVLHLEGTLRLYGCGVQVEIQTPAHWRERDPERLGHWPERFLLEVVWVANDPQAYGGSIHVHAYAEDDLGMGGLSEELLSVRGLLRSESCPMNAAFRDSDGSPRPFLLLEAAAKGVAAIALSCRGTNPDAPRLHDWLWKQEPALPSFYYRGEQTLEETANDHTEAVLGRLGAAQVVVLFLDDAYLDAVVESNRYCLEELALALFRFDGDNRTRLAGRLSGRGYAGDFKARCKRLAGKLYENATAKGPRESRHTVLYAPALRQDQIPQRIDTAVKALGAFLDTACKSLEPNAHPLWYLKRELVQVLIDDGGMDKFNSCLADTSAAIADFDTLCRRVLEVCRR